MELVNRELVGSSVTAPGVVVAVAVEAVPAIVVASVVAVVLVVSRVRFLIKNRLLFLRGILVNSVLTSMSSGSDGLGSLGIGFRMEGLLRLLMDWGFWLSVGTGEEDCEKRSLELVGNLSLGLLG